MIYASKNTFSHYNLKILRLKVTKNLTNLLKNFCEFWPNSIFLLTWSKLSRSHSRVKFGFKMIFKNRLQKMYLYFFMISLIESFIKIRNFCLPQLFFMFPNFILCNKNLSSIKYMYYFIDLSKAQDFFCHIRHSM